jgi:hypothetical protein
MMALSQSATRTRSSSLSERELAIRRRLKDELEHYAAKCLRIRPDLGGGAVPFVFNRSQQILHARLEEQRARTGRVRALVLKGRKMGISTYVGARYFHKVTHRRGIRVYILTHQQEATDTLFGMVERYYENLPGLVKPELGMSNAKALAFPRLDSDYTVGTAGTKATGRSQTIQLFHGSEVAFWPHAPTHFAGVVQAVTKGDDTEIILESTANGMGDEFHQRWQQAEAGKGEYIAVFLPWFWDERYRRKPEPGFVLDDEEQDYADAHGLDLEQMAWRRFAIAELRDPLLFKQEYPATAQEAFQNTGHDSYIRPEIILRARKAQHAGVGSLVLGVDPSRFGDDRFAVAWRRGRCVEKVEAKGKLDNVAGANWIRQIIDADKPARVFIDVGGQGAGVYDILVDWGYGDRDGDRDRGIVKAIDFGGAPQGDPIEWSDVDGKPLAGPRYRRDEMWMRSRRWLEDAAGAQIPDDDELHADACAPGYSYDMVQRLVIESKVHMRKRGVRSPDKWDAVVLTFAEPVPSGERRERGPRRSRGGWQGS